MKNLILLTGLLGMTAPLQGCVIAAAAGAGYMIHDESTEKDGKFDPLEDVIDYGDDDDEKDKGD